jgi:hypothetical protein
MHQLHGDGLAIGPSGLANVKSSQTENRHLSPGFSQRPLRHTGATIPLLCKNLVGKTQYRASGYTGLKKMATTGLVGSVGHARSPWMTVRANDLRHPRS